MPAERHWCSATQSVAPGDELDCEPCFEVLVAFTTPPFQSHEETEDPE